MGLYKAGSTDRAISHAETQWWHREVQPSLLWHAGMAKHAGPAHGGHMGFFFAILECCPECSLQQTSPGPVCCKWLVPLTAAYTTAWTPPPAYVRIPCITPGPSYTYQCCITYHKHVPVHRHATCCLPLPSSPCWTCWPPVSCPPYHQ